MDIEDTKKEKESVTSDLPEQTTMEENPEIIIKSITLLSSKKERESFFDF